jgi:hypothetical protein
MELVLRTHLGDLAVETRVTDGHSHIEVQRGAAILAADDQTGAALIRHFAVSEAVAADPAAASDVLRDLPLRPSPATFVVESVGPAGTIRTQVNAGRATVTVQGPDGTVRTALRPADQAAIGHGLAWQALLAPDDPPPRLAADPAHIPHGVRVALGLDSRPWHCGTVDGARWVLWTVTEEGRVTTPRHAGRVRVWPSERAAREEAAARGYVVAADPEPVPPALRQVVVAPQRKGVVANAPDLGSDHSDAPRLERHDPHPVGAVRRP